MMKAVRQRIAMPVDLQIDDALLADSAAPTDLVTPLLLENIVRAARAATRDSRLNREICLRICSAGESRGLNQTYRGIDRATNILSFPAEIPHDLLPEGEAPLGDLALCWSVLMTESQAQSKTPTSHFTHLFLHGVLHLLGYDHIEDEDARQMEALEVEVLAGFGIDNPYL